MINVMFGMINHIKQLHFDLNIMIRCLFELAIHDMIATLPEKKTSKVVRFRSLDVQDKNTPDKSKQLIKYACDTSCFKCTLFDTNCHACHV